MEIKIVVVVVVVVAESKKIRFTGESKMLKLRTNKKIIYLCTARQHKMQTFREVLLSLLCLSFLLSRIKAFTTGVSQTVASANYYFCSLFSQCRCRFYRQTSSTEVFS